MNDELYNEYRERLIANLELFSRTKMTLKQKRDILNIEHEYEVTIYLVGAYNCYAITHRKESLSLITNPDALFRTPEAEQQFIIELKKYIRDVIGIKREDVQYGTSNSNRSKQETAKNK